MILCRNNTFVRPWESSRADVIHFTDGYANEDDVFVDRSLQQDNEDLLRQQRQIQMQRQVQQPLLRGSPQQPQRKER